MNTTTTLDQLANGSQAIVVGLRVGDRVSGDAFAARGVVPGVELTVVRAGDPMVFALDRSRWAISRHEARAIEVSG